VTTKRPALVEAPAMLTEPAHPAPVTPGKPLARITVRRLAVRDVVLAGPASHDGMARGPMMVKRGDAASPITVLAAHRDTHFLFIRDLREGDIVTMQYVTGEVEHYRVTYLETVRWDEFAYPLDPPRPLLALATCYPFGGTEYGGPWRRVAWAERIG
jgi:sortase A